MSQSPCGHNGYDKITHQRNSKLEEVRSGTCVKDNCWYLERVARRYQERLQPKHNRQEKFRSQRKTTEGCSRMLRKLTAQSSGGNRTHSWWPPEEPWVRRRDCGVSHLMPYVSEIGKTNRTCLRWVQALSIHPSRHPRLPWYVTAS